MILLVAVHSWWLSAGCVECKSVLSARVCPNACWLPNLCFDICFLLYHLWRTQNVHSWHYDQQGSRSSSWLEAVSQCCASHFGFLSLAFPETECKQSSRYLCAQYSIVLNIAQKALDSQCHLSSKFLRLFTFAQSNFFWFWPNCFHCGHSIWG